MAILAIIAMICGPVNVGDILQQAQSKNCYKDLILCVERKKLRFSNEEALNRCILEM